MGKVAAAVNNAVLNRKGNDCPVCARVPTEKFALRVKRRSVFPLFTSSNVKPTARVNRAVTDRQCPHRIIRARVPTQQITIGIKCGEVFTLFAICLTKRATGVDYVIVKSQSMYRVVCARTPSGEPSSRINLCQTVTRLTCHFSKSPAYVPPAFAIWDRDQNIIVYEGPS